MSTGQETSEAEITRTVDALDARLKRSVSLKFSSGIEVATVVNKTESAFGVGFSFQIGERRVFINAKDMEASARSRTFFIVKESQ